MEAKEILYNLLHENCVLKWHIQLPDAGQFYSVEGVNS